MKTLLLTVALLAQAAAGWSYQGRAGAGDTEVRSLLVHQVELAGSAPQPGETLWVQLQDSVDKVRSAQEMISALDGQVRAGRSKDARGLGEARARVERLRKAYHEVLWPGLKHLANAMDATGKLTARTALLFKKREAEADLKRYPEAAEILAADARIIRPDPDYDPVVILKDQRERAFAIAVKAEGMLVKADERLRSPAGRRPAAPGSLAWVLDRAEAAMAQTAATARRLSTGARELSGDFREALASTERFVAEAAHETIKEEDRADGARAINQVSRRYTTLEYGVSSDSREAHIFWDLVTTDRVNL